MLHLLSDNILQYVLNQYLDWEYTIPKLHKLDFFINSKNKIIFNIKPHITKRYNYFADNIVKWVKTYIDNKLFTIDRFDIFNEKVYRKEYRFNKLINEQRFSDGMKISENNLKNGKLYGKSYAWDFNGNLTRISSFYNDMFHGLQMYYMSNVNYVDRRMIMSEKNGRMIMSSCTKLVELREYKYGVMVKWEIGI
jgi:antitoxin component YwqK of YwqJK toxin-antitoxin module